jgi:hypothetical protein
MNSERIKQIQLQTAYPESHSVKDALLQVWNECQQENAKLNAERMYSEIELEVAFFEGRENGLTFIEWFQQFKKKP